MRTSDLAFRLAMGIVAVAAITAILDPGGKGASGTVAFVSEVR